MMELWAVVGRILLNKNFHEEVFKVAKPGSFFEDLKDLRKALRVTNRQNLGRWEIMVINEHLTQSNPDIRQTALIIANTAADVQVQPIRDGWGGAPPDFPLDFDLCAVVGLASMDFQFREDLFNATDPNVTRPNTQRLNNFLTDRTTETPVFALTSLQLINLNNLMRYESGGIGMVNRLRDYHIQKWIQPLDYPCNGGYTETIGTHFVYFAQTALVRTVELEADGKDKLQRHGVQFA